MKTLSGYIVLIVCFFGLLFLRHELRDYEHIPFLSQDFRKSSLSERQMKERIALVENEVDSLRSLLENDAKEPIAGKSVTKDVVSKGFEHINPVPRQIIAAPLPGSQ